MKLGEKTMNMLACVAFILAAGLGVKAWELWSERQLAVEEADRSQTQLTQRMRFADEHSDYEAYKNKLFDKQKKLEQQAEQQLTLNSRLQRLQKQAQAQNIQLSSMQLEGKPVVLQQGLQMQTMKISAIGDFFSLLRWLRQAERDGCKVKELRLQNSIQAYQVLNIELFIQLPTLN